MKIKSFFQKNVFKKKNIPYFLIFLVLIAGIVFLVFRKKVDEYVVEDHLLYQYFSGQRMDYENSKIKLNKNGDITTISFGDYKVNLDSTPLYYGDEKKVLFPQAMAVIKPLQAKQSRINYYSSVYNDLDSYTIKDGKETYNLSNVFLYDGIDSYFIIDPSIITFGEHTFQVSPLSYINVNTFDHSVQVYDYDNDDAQFFENVEDEVFIETGTYRVNATLDLYYFNDSSKLLMKDVSILKHL